MDQTDIIQEFASSKQEETLGGADILSEYINSLKDTEATNETTEETVNHESEENGSDNSGENDIINTEDNGDDSDILDEEDFIKSRTNGKFSSWDELEKEIGKESSGLGKFENETSKAIYQLLVEGKFDEVSEVLQKSAFSKAISNKSDEDILKAYIKTTNPDFDEDDIEDEYNEKYQIDEFSIDESKLKREQKKINQRIKSDVLEAKDFFSKNAEEIKFSSYKAEENDNEEDDSLITEERNKFLSSLTEAKSSINTLPFAWKDDKTNISINGKFDIPAQELSKYSEGAENLETYMAEKYYQDGKYKADQLLKDLYIADNFNKILNSVVSQAVNQTRLEILKKSKNITIDSEQSATFRPSVADEEKSMFDQLFMGHLSRQQ